MRGLLAMSLALWRRWQWARVWMVLTTVIAVLTLVMLIWRGPWMTQWLTLLSLTLRIAVAGMLFLPSARRWFAPRRV